MEDQYIVAAGDTFPKIARKLGESRKTFYGEQQIRDLISLNGLKDSGTLFEGQTLILPSPQRGENLTQSGSNGKTYTVRYGDTLSKIAETFYGNGAKSSEIAACNKIKNQDQIFIGQELVLPQGAKPGVNPAKKNQSVGSTSSGKFYAKHLLARSFLFIVADEIAPSGTVVRKVVYPKKIQNDAELVKQIIRPEKYGLQPRNPGTNVTIGRHVLGMTESKYISTSSRLFGSPRFKGPRYWINIRKVLESGGTIHDADAIAKDLSRIAKKTKDPRRLKYIEDITLKSIMIDKEVLIEGAIPRNAIKGVASKALTHGFQFVSLVGVVVSSYDLAYAVDESYTRQTFRPIAAESLKQLGGWGAAYLGSKIGASFGALLGIETGPGAVLTAATGGLVFGMAGFFGANWIAEYINPSAPHE